MLNCYCFYGLSSAYQKSCYPKPSQQLTKPFSTKFQTSAVRLKPWSCLDFNLTLKKTPLYQKFNYPIFVFPHKHPDRRQPSCNRASIFLYLALNCKGFSYYQLSTLKYHPDLCEINEMANEILLSPNAQTQNMNELCSKSDAHLF